MPMDVKRTGSAALSAAMEGLSFAPLADWLGAGAPELGTTAAFPASDCLTETALDET